MTDLQPGTNATIASDVVINGSLVFGSGEQVIIEQVSPNQARPEYRYVVTSSRTGARFQLREADFVARPAAAQFLEPPPTGPVSAGPVTPIGSERNQVGTKAPHPVGKPASRTGGTRSKQNTVVKVLIAVIVVAALGVAAFFLLSGRKSSQPATTSSSTSSGTSADVSSGVPLYPGAVFSQAVTEKNVAGKYYKTPADPQAVVNWYQQQLRNMPGYQMQNVHGIQPTIYFLVNINGHYKGIEVTWSIGPANKPDTTITIGNNATGTIPNAK
jgi:hypothetical protein